MAHSLVFHFGLEGIVLCASVGFAVQVYRQRRETGFLLLLLALIAALLARLVSAVVLTTVPPATMRSAWFVLIFPLQRLVGPVLMLAALIVLASKTRLAPPLPPR